MSLLERIGGCCCERERDEFERRPPTTRRPQSPRVGLSDMRVLDPLSGQPVDRRCLS